MPTPHARPRRPALIPNDITLSVEEAEEIHRRTKANPTPAAVSTPQPLLRNPFDVLTTSAVGTQANNSNDGQVRCSRQDSNIQANPADHSVRPVEGTAADALGARKRSPPTEPATGPNAPFRRNKINGFLLGRDGRHAPAIEPRALSEPEEWGFLQGHVGPKDYFPQSSHEATTRKGPEGLILNATPLDWERRNSSAKRRLEKVDSGARGRGFEFVVSIRTPCATVPFPTRRNNGTGEGRRGMRGSGSGEDIAHPSGASLPPWQVGGRVWSG